ncbi:MAG: diguanylate cyclase [Eubacteriales bacterium]|nr:diguanylate cyclase [Eubacteriales bacterium]
MGETTKEKQLLKNDLEISKEEEEEEAAVSSIFSEDFCAALDSTTLATYIIDPDSFKMCYCNDFLRKYLGWNPIGQPCYKAIQNLDEPCPNCVARKLYQEGVNETTEYCTDRGKWVLVRVSPLMWRGKEFYKLIAIDITRQKELEAELRLRNKEYAAVTRQCTSGILRYDLATGAASVNVDRCLNRVEEHVIQDYVEVARNSGIIDPGSLPTAAAMLEDIRGGRPSKGYDLRLILEQGTRCWCHLDYALIQDDEGRPYRAVVSFYDNTEQRERELAYQRWNARLETLMEGYIAYFEVNLTQDVIEAEVRSGSWGQDLGRHGYGESVLKMEMDEVFVDDRLAFREFFDRDRLLGRFHAGEREGYLEYRILAEQGPLWYRAELQMVREPSSDDVKCSVVLSNVDVKLRERESLRNKAERDIMTGLYNHATAESLIQEALRQDGGERCCLLIIDLDDLREINSSLGHPEGDRALQLVAECMRTHFGEENILGRIGGDEFVALLRDVPEGMDLHALVSGFLGRMNRCRIGVENDWKIHASVGGAVGTAGSADFKTLYHQADLALFYTKAMGKNDFNLYVPELEKREFLYQPHSTATLSRMDAFDSSEFKKLLQAVSAYFPMVISVNLTQNTYYMMEYMSYGMQKHRDHGNFDNLIVDGADSFHPEDRESFIQAFSRERLLEAYARGERFVRHKGRQLGDDGIYRPTKGVVIFVDDENSEDICEITFSHMSARGTEDL